MLRMGCGRSKSLLSALLLSGAVSYVAICVSPAPCPVAHPTTATATSSATWEAVVVPNYCMTGTPGFLSWRPLDDVFVHRAASLHFVFSQQLADDAGTTAGRHVDIFAAGALNVVRAFPDDVPSDAYIWEAQIEYYAIEAPVASVVLGARLGQSAARTTTTKGA